MMSSDGAPRAKEMVEAAMGRNVLPGVRERGVSRPTTRRGRSGPVPTVEVVEVVDVVPVPGVVVVGVVVPLTVLRSSSSSVSGIGTRRLRVARSWARAR